GIVNWFILVPVALKIYGNITLLFLPNNFFVHGLIPLLVFIDWLIFDPKGIYRRYDSWKWALTPLVYTLLIYIRAYFGKPIFQGSQFPYPFYDPKAMHGWLHVYVLLGLILLIYLIMGKILYNIKK
ncbi:hypothetical protein D2A91_14165, partial [Enterococcus faecalis]|nr:hypothetical protein [Enterococcus faecalis]